MLFAAPITGNPDNATSRTTRTVNDRLPGVCRESGEQPFATELLAPRGLPTMYRQALIDRVRLQIANGSYETQAKIDALLPRLAKGRGLATRPPIV